MDIEIIDRARADTDYAIGYIDGQPVAIAIDPNGEVVGYYAVIDEGELIINVYDGYRWWVEGGRWACNHVSLPVPEGYTERTIEDGGQSLLYRDDVPADIVLV